MKERITGQGWRWVVRFLLCFMNSRFNFGGVAVALKLGFNGVAMPLPVAFCYMLYVNAVL